MQGEAIAVPTAQGSRTSDALLRMILENAYVDPCVLAPGKGILTILLDDCESTSNTDPAINDGQHYEIICFF
jgi:hypothetical protein